MRVLGRIREWLREWLGIAKLERSIDHLQKFCGRSVIEQESTSKQLADLRAIINNLGVEAKPQQTSARNLGDLRRFVQGDEEL